MARLCDLTGFTTDGVMPPGDYATTIGELGQSFLVHGPRGATPLGWDVEWRGQLVRNVAFLAAQLWSTGIGPVYLDGSFVEDKCHPNDIDGYFACELHELASGALEDRLNRLDEYKVWTWAPESRRPYRGYPKLQLPMWHRYRVELYPHYGQGTGVLDEFGYEFAFPSLFRQRRTTGQQKGIVVLTPESIA